MKIAVLLLLSGACLCAQLLDEGESNLMTSEANLDDFDDRAETIELQPRETLARDLKLRPAIGK